MATRILLADDSMTAQKMGKEILTAAGYEVTAVSNGAAASKKLVDKFDVIILDVYMPGYSGLEVCEKVRANMEIAKTPVLLTVGKMEHYEPADTQRVKADGVIVKPFEATDLLAIVKKLAEKSAAAAAPSKPEYEKTMIFTASQVQEFKDQSYADWKTEAPSEAEVAEAPSAPAFEMTHAEASAPAFAMDMAPSVSSFDETVNIPPAPVVTSSFDETVGFPTSAPAMEFSTAAAAAPAFESPTMETAPTPVFEAAAMPTVDPALETGPSEAQGYSIPATDPALAQPIEIQREEFVTHVTTPAPEPELEMDEAAELAAAATEIAGTSSPDPGVDDFDARVANAMSGYETGYETAEVVEAVEAEPEAGAAVPESNIIVEAVNYEAKSAAEPPAYERTQKITAFSDAGAAPATEVMAESVPETLVEAVVSPAPGVGEVVEASIETPADTQAPPDGMQDASLVEQMQAAFADLPVETAPHVVEEPIAESPAPEAVAPMAAVAPAGSGQDMELASALAAAMGEQSSTAMAASSSPAASLMDHHTIAQVVTRVMERMLPSVMHEIAKELEAAKK